MSRRNQSSHFNQVPKANLPRSSFRMPSNLKTSFNTSILYPIYCREVLPGDTVNMNVANFIRQNPTVTAVMDNLYVDMHFFFVPNRLVWDHWEEFNGQQKDPSSSTSYLIPTVSSPPVTGWNLQSPASHLGVRFGVAGISHSSLPLRMYNLIWNEWFRDQNLSNSAKVDTGDGPDLATDYSTLLPRGKFHDYFTSGLPWPQKGSAVSIPVTVPSTGRVETTGTLTSRVGVYNNTTSSVNVLDTTGNYANLSTGLSSQADLVTNFSGIIAGTINALRQAEAVQSFLERDARGGTRYTEFIRSHFGVVNPDFRLQRPEYLGGNSIPVTMTPVLQTAESGTTPQGNIAGMGTLNSQNAHFVKSFTEHGYIIGLMSARSDLHYQQGTERSWFRSTKYDFYVPEFAHLGEKAILNEEIFTQGTAADKQAFAYQEIWSEYKYHPSRIAGTMNSDAPGGSLDVWHYAQDFSVLPSLNESFIKDATPELRIQAVTTESTFIADIHFDQIWTRVMPMYSIPGIGTRL